MISEGDIYPYGWTDAYDNLESYQYRLSRYQDPVKECHEQDSADS